MALEAVLFDAGNTVMLVNYAVVAEALASEGFDVQEDLVREAEYRARVRLDPILARRNSTEAPEIFRTYIGFVCEGLGVEWGAATERAFRWLAEYNREHNLWNRPNPQARAVLERLQSRNLAVGMISNSDGSIERMITEQGLAPYFRFVLDSQVVGIEKPDPRIFQMALERAGVEPAEAVYIGDLYSIDVVGSRAAGMDAILLDPAGLWGHVDCAKAQDLSEVATIILQRLS
ncbi:MAG: HAD-IA family hydrolase [Candidatus Methylomirabilis oxyfera]|nr:HAD-IA family hydrolase [Candidatus Methylomirabilis oxyfera]